MKTTDAMLVGFDFTNGKDHGVLIVGRRNNGESVDIVNAFFRTKKRNESMIFSQQEKILEVTDGRKKT